MKEPMSCCVPPPSKAPLTRPVSCCIPLPSKEPMEEPMSCRSTHRSAHRSTHRSTQENCRRHWTWREGRKCWRGWHRSGVLGTWSSRRIRCWRGRSRSRGPGRLGVTGRRKGGVGIGPAVDDSIGVGVGDVGLGVDEDIWTSTWTWREG